MRSRSSCIDPLWTRRPFASLLKNHLAITSRSNGESGLKNQRKLTKNLFKVLLNGELQRKNGLKRLISSTYAAILPCIH